MYRFILLCSIALFLFVACQAEGENSGDREGKKTMDLRYYQPYANERLNSFQPIDITAKGKKAWKFEFNTIEHPGDALFLHLMDDSHAVIDCGGVFFAVDLIRKNTVASIDKSANTFIRLTDGLGLRYFDAYRLQKSEFYKLLEPEPEEPEDETGQKPGEPPDMSPRDSYVPWLGQRSELTAFVPGKKEFICGILHYGTPQEQNISFVLHATPYDDFEAKWERRYPTTAVAPPLGDDKRFVILLPGEMHFVDTDGHDLETVKTPGEPVCCSIGPDDMMYAVQETDEDVYLRAFDSFGDKRWEVAGVSDAVIQPPVVSDAGLVYLVGEEELTAYKDGERLWAISLNSDLGRATAASGSLVVVVDGSRVRCLDENGKEVWVYIDEDGEEYTSSPVIDAGGNVLVASGMRILKIQ